MVYLCTSTGAFVLLDPRTLPFAKTILANVFMLRVEALATLNAQFPGLDSPSK